MHMYCKATCKLSNSELEHNMCTITGHNVTIAVIGSNSDANLIVVNAGYHTQQDMRFRVPKNKNSACSTMLYIYEMVCISFITYNIIMFMIALL